MDKRPRLDRRGLLSRIHGGNSWGRPRSKELPLLDFSVDVNPLGFSPRIRQILLRHLDDIRGYPDPDARALRHAIAGFHRFPIETILPGNGSAELIGLLTRLHPSPKVLVIIPTFSEYEWAARQAGAMLAYQVLEEGCGFRLDPAAMDEVSSLIDGTDLVFLCNPNNPTGVALPNTVVLKLARRCGQAGALLIIDEAFIDFVEEPHGVSVLPDALTLGHVIVMRSLTKWWAIPGLRLGYLVAPAPLVKRLRALQQPWPLNALALAVGRGLFSDPEPMSDLRRQLRAWCEVFWRHLQAIPGLRPFPTATNFVLCKLSDSRITSTELTQRLARQGLLIRNCDSFTGLEPGRFIRMAVRTPEENERLLTALREAVIT